MRLGATAALACLALGALACGPGEGSAPPAAAPPAASAPAPSARPPAVSPAQAAEAFAVRCSSCHGEGGKGDGPASQGLTPKPRDLGDPAWQGSVSDEHIERVIAYGGAAVGLSPIMPSHPDLAGQPAMLAALRAHVRSLAR